MPAQSPWLEYVDLFSDFATQEPIPWETKILSQVDREDTCALEPQGSEFDLTLPNTGCVTLGLMLYLSVPQFSQSLSTTNTSLRAMMKFKRESRCRVFRLGIWLLLTLLLMLP